MKYKNFDEWLRNSRYVGFYGKQKNAMLDAWDAAVENYPDKIEYIDRTKTEINELQGIITGTLEIQCTCDQAQMKKGYQCNCGKQKAVQKAVSDLTFYLKELKK